MDGLPASPLRRRFPAILILLFFVVQFSALLFFLGAFFVYPGYRTRAFREAQADKPASCVLDLDREPATRRTIQDEAWILELDRIFNQAEYFRKNHPHREREFYLRVTRSSSRTDQYLVFFDTRGPEYDHFSVVNRSGNSTWYGSAFRAPDLRRLMERSGVK